MINRGGGHTINELGSHLGCGFLPPSGMSVSNTVHLEAVRICPHGSWTWTLIKGVKLQRNRKCNSRSPDTKLEMFNWQGVYVSAFNELHFCSRRSDNCLLRLLPRGPSRISKLLTDQRATRMCSYSGTAPVKGQKMTEKCVTMRNAELVAETRLRLNIGLAEQRPNPFRDKCRVSEAHLLCGPRFNNWHYNSISHHYRAYGGAAEMGSAREKSRESGWKTERAR